MTRFAEGVARSKIPIAMALLRFVLSLSWGLFLKGLSLYYLTLLIGTVIILTGGLALLLLQTVATALGWVWST